MKPYFFTAIRAGFGLGFTFVRLPWHLHNRGRGRSYRLYRIGWTYQLELQLLAWYVVIAIDVRDPKPVVVESGKKEVAA